MAWEFYIRDPIVFCPLVLKTGASSASALGEDAAQLPTRPPASRKWERRFSTTTSSIDSSGNANAPRRPPITATAWLYDRAARGMPATAGLFSLAFLDGEELHSYDPFAPGGPLCQPWNLP